MAKISADLLVVEQGLATSRSHAQALILAGAILHIDGNRIEKSGEQLSLGTELRIKGKPIPYVSRGGLKLEKALDHFGIGVAGRTCLDIGASTGGFSDCLLQRDAEKIYAVDVGYGQMAWKIRQDPKVVCIERTNIRHMTTQVVPERCRLVVIDVSFISLSLVLPAALPFTTTDAEFICLVKPQFEAGAKNVGKGGIVTDPQVHIDVLAKIEQLCIQLGLSHIRTTDSPITGAKGNREFLLTAKR